MEYMTKVECWSISINRSYRPESNIKLLRFSLSRGYLIYIYKKKGQSKLFLDSIEVQKSQYSAQIRIDMSKAGLITPIPNSK